MARESHGAEAVIDLLATAQRAPASDVYEADVAIFKSAQGSGAAGGDDKEGAGGGDMELPRVLSDSENYLAYTLKNGCALRFLDRSNNRRCLLKAHTRPIHAVRFVKYHSNVGASAAEGEFFVWVVTDGAHAGKGSHAADGDASAPAPGGKLTVSLYLALRDAVTVHTFAFFINPAVGGPDVLLLYDRKASILESSRLIRQYADATMDATLASDARDLRALSRPADRHSLCTCRAGDWFVFTIEPTLVVACTLRNRSTPAWSPCAGDAVRALELLDVFAPDAPALLLASTDARVYQWALAGDAEPALLRVFAFGGGAGGSSVPRIVAMLSSRHTVAIFNDAAQAVLVDCAASGDSYAATLFAMDAVVSPPGLCFNRTQSYGFVLASNTKCIKMYQLMLDGNTTTTTASSGSHVVTSTTDAATAAAPAAASVVADGGATSPPPPPQQQTTATTTTTTVPSSTTQQAAVVSPPSSSSLPVTSAPAAAVAAPTARTSPQAQPLPLRALQQSVSNSRASPSSPLTADPAVLSVSSNTTTPHAPHAMQQTQQQSARATASPVLSPTRRATASPSANHGSSSAVTMTASGGGGGGSSVISGLLQQLERGNLKPASSSASASAASKPDGATVSSNTAALTRSDGKAAAPPSYAAPMPGTTQQNSSNSSHDGSNAAAAAAAALPPPPPPPLSTTMPPVAAAAPPPPTTVGSIGGRVALHNVALPQSGDSLLAAAAYQGDASVRKELEGLQTVITNVVEIAELTPSQITRDHEQLVHLALEAQMTELQSLCAAAAAADAKAAAAAKANATASSANAAAMTAAQRDEEEAFNSFAIVKLIAPLSKEIASGVTRGLRDTLRTELDNALRAALGNSVRETQKTLIKRRLDEALRETSAFYTHEVGARIGDFVERELAVGLGRFTALLQRALEDNRRLRSALQRATELSEVYSDLAALRAEVTTLRESLASGAYARVSDDGSGGGASTGGGGGGGAHVSSFVQPGRPTPETMLSTARALLASGKTNDALFYITEVRQPELTLQLLRDVNGDAYTRMVADEGVSDEVWLRVLSQLCNSSSTSSSSSSSQGDDKATEQQQQQQRDDVHFVAELMFDVLAEHDTLTVARTAQAQQCMSDIRHFIARVKRSIGGGGGGSSGGDAAAQHADTLRILRGLEKSLV